MSYIIPSINPASLSIQKEEGEFQAQKDTERQRQEREILKLQEEEERQLRKKVFMTPNSIMIELISISDTQSAALSTYQSLYVATSPQRIEEIMKRTRKSDENQEEMKVL